VRNILLRVKLKAISLFLFIGITQLIIPRSATFAIADDLSVFLDLVTNALNERTAAFSANSFCENALPWNNLRIGKATVAHQASVSATEAFVMISFQASELLAIH
jgi:hypothetical protein